MKIKKANVDWFVFSMTVMLLILVCGFLIESEQAGQLISWTFSMITGQLGVIYIWITIATIIFLLVIAFGRFGATLLGPPTESFLLLWVLR